MSRCTIAFIAWVIIFSPFFYCVAKAIIFDYKIEKEITNENPIHKP